MEVRDGSGSLQSLVETVDQFVMVVGLAQEAYCSSLLATSSCVFLGGPKGSSQYSVVQRSPLIVGSVKKLGKDNPPRGNHQRCHAAGCEWPINESK